MTRKELSQIYYINHEIEMWKRELDSLGGLQSPKLDGLPKAPDISDSTGDMAIKRSQIQQTVDGLLVKLQLKRAEIYNWIATLDDSVMRQVVMYRCLSLCSWEEVAAYIGGNNTPDSVRMTFNRFLEK